MGTTSKGSLLLKEPDRMVKLSCSTKGLETKLEEDKPYYSPTTTTSHPCMRPPCKTTELSIRGEGEVEEEAHQANRKQKSVLGSIVSEGADLPSWHASIDTIAGTVVKPVIANSPALRGNEEEVLGLRPRYLRHNLWTPDSDPKMTVAEWSCHARALPRPSQSEWENLSASRTVEERPDLFEIVSPIKVDNLRRLTNAHPNRPFVESVLEGLESGFWPWAVTNREGYPVTHDESKLVKFSEEKEEFLLSQLKHEQELDRMSHEFGETLLPGMYCMPQYVVPKPHSNGWRLVNDQSAGNFSLNSMVERQYILGFPLDNLSHFGELLLRKRREKPGMSFVAWKSDVTEAYRICPMHKLWQLKQVVRIKGKLFVDRVNVFGGSGSGPIFISVNSLVAWVAKHEIDVDDLVYVDDSFGVEVLEEKEFYPPYGEDFPKQQTKLLKLWDEIGIPHKRKKQENGNRLAILGIIVDTEHLTFTLPDEAKDRLVKELMEWCEKGVRRKVKEWQQLAGWVNWALNVFPLLRPSLNNVYHKLRGKGQEARIWANNAIREDLKWARDKVDESDGVRLLKSLTWDVSLATCTAKTDACPRGFAFWYPELDLGFTAATPHQTPDTQITFYETLAVLSVLDDARRRFPPESKLVIYTDNFSAVAMFNSLRALPEYNCILKASVDILLDSKFDLRVLHVAGENNDVADALSRGDFMRALRIRPNISIKAFEPFQRVDRHQSPPFLRPPRHSLGAAVY